MQNIYKNNALSFFLLHIIFISSSVYSYVSVSIFLYLSFSVISYLSILLSFLISIYLNLFHNSKCLYKKVWKLIKGTMYMCLYYLIKHASIYIYIYIYEVHTISFQIFFVWAFKIVIDSWKFTMLLLYTLWDDLPIFMISGSNEQLQQQLEYTLLKPDCHSLWISKMQSDTLEERYGIKLFYTCKKCHRNVWNASDCFWSILHESSISFWVA